MLVGGLGPDLPGCGAVMYLGHRCHPAGWARTVAYSAVSEAGSWHLSGCKAQEGLCQHTGVGLG